MSLGAFLYALAGDIFLAKFSFVAWVIILVVIIVLLKSK